MKKIIPIIIMLILSPAIGFGQSDDMQYIRDTLYISLRAQPGSQSEIVRSGLVSGTSVMVLSESEDGDYSFVRTMDGDEGWLQTQYLSENPAARDVLDQLNTSLDQSEAEKIQLEVALQEAMAELEQTRSTLEQVTAVYDEEHQAYEELKTVSGNAQELSDTLKQALEDNSRLNTELEANLTHTAQLEAELGNDSFWKGAFAIMIGMILSLLIAIFWPKKRTEWN